MNNNLTWQEKAKCATDDANVLKIFFYDKNEDDDDPGTDEPVDYTQEAIRICFDCPVRRDCLQYALDNEERFGVWGGADESTRRWANSIDQYGKPIQRVREMKCPYCTSTEIITVGVKKLRSQLKCTSCNLIWWSRKLSVITPLENDSDID